MGLLSGNTHFSMSWGPSGDLNLQTHTLEQCIVGSVSHSPFVSLRLTISIQWGSADSHKILLQYYMRNINGTLELLF